MLYKEPTLGEVIAKEVSKALSSLNPIQSEWSYIGFDSAGGSISMPIGGSIGASGGVLKVKENASSQANSIKCGSIDGGLGISPVPFNATFPLPDMPGTGIVFKLPCIGNDVLSLNSFRGGYITLGGSIACGITGSLSFMFFGAKTLPTFPNPRKLVPSIILTSPVLIVSLSSSGSLTPDAGLNASIGVAI